MNIKEQIAASIYESISGERDERKAITPGLIRQAVDEGIPIEEIIRDGLIPGMGPVSQDFKENRIYVPEVLLAASVFQSGIEELKPRMEESGHERKGPAIIGCVQGDLHYLGKNLVAMMLEADGYQVHDLGSDVDKNGFAIAAKQYDARLVCISSLLTTTVVHMRASIEAIQTAGLYDKVKILVGGSPVSERLATEFGAHGYADSCFSAVQVANRLL